MGSSVFISGTDSPRVDMKNIVAAFIVEATHEHLPEAWKNDTTLEECFEVLKLLNIPSLDELDEARFMAFYQASSQARLEYESRPRETERAESWFQHINGLWRCVLELMEQDPRFRR